MPRGKATTGPNKVLPIPTTTVKVPRELHEVARTILDALHRYGWAGLGVDRSDPPSMQAVMDEAIRQLAARIPQPKGKQK